MAGRRRHLGQLAGVALIVCVAGIPAPAQAWGTLLLIDAPPATSTFAIGPSAWRMPAYPGASGSREFLIPGLDYEGSSGFFASTDTAIGWNLAHRRDLQAGLRVWPQLGRAARDLPPGVEPLGLRLQLEAFLNYQLLPALLLQGGALRGSGRHHDGAQIEMGATSGLPLGEDLLGMGVAVSYANRAHHQSYFGVTTSEAAASGLPAYAPAGGRQDLSLTFSGEHRFSKAWRLDGQLIIARFAGSVARSPLVQSRQQPNTTLTLWRDL